jgi:hypothetical protein
MEQKVRNLLYLLTCLFVLLTLFLAFSVFDH